MIRRAAFDDRAYPPGFYPGGAEKLRALIESFDIRGEAKGRAIGAMAPHAGLRYSGAVARAVYDSCEMPATAVLLGPNHTGFGRGFALWSSGAWETPFGALEVDEELAARLLAECRHVEEDTSAHEGEHSLEVQLPFIALARKDARIVPVAISANDPGRIEDFGKALARAIGERRDEVTVFASSDMTHYESQKDAQRKDRLAIERVLALDAKGLFRVVKENGISMCGVAPAMAMLHAARYLGAKEAKLVAYRTSGDETGDYLSVVGYAGVVVR